MSEQKVCSLCGIGKPATAEYFFKSKKHPGGLTARCRMCVREQQGVDAALTGAERQANWRARKREGAKFIEWLYLWVHKLHADEGVSTDELLNRARKAVS